MTGVSLLYIDDDPAMVRLVQRAFGRRGIAVTGASTIDDGLAKVAAGGVDVIALDHFLASGTGLDFLARLKAVESAPPVVYVTGSGETSIAVAALKAGAADYVPKAVDDEFLELLASAVNHALEKARLQRERDQAEREVRLARDRAEAMLHEVNHRVANSLSLVGSLVQLQANAMSDPEARAAFAQIQARIMAIASVHRRLYTSSDVRSVEIAEFLGKLLPDLEASLNASAHTSGQASALRLDADEMVVSTDKAVSIGVIVTELVTNAFKYAYPAASRGEIRVRLRRQPDDRINLTVEDDGVGWTGEGTPKGTGVGSRIVAATARGLGATLRYAAGPGCGVSLEFAV
jgi:two-component sensor histidine kinase